MKTGDPAWKTALFQAPVIIASAFVMAAGFNLVRGNALPFIGDWSIHARISDAAGASMVISLEEARELFLRGGALFLDARPRDQFELGHIKGAVSLPAQEAEGRFSEAAQALDQARAIITYCDGENCDLSHKLALILKEMGFAEVKVLVNGWSLWRQAELPWEKGS